jgi:hypothetical protein
VILRIDSKVLESLVQYLNGEGDEIGPWSALCFMEKNGIDPALLAEILHAYLTDPNLSPLPQAANLRLQDERAIVLELRGRARRELGLEPLTPIQIVNWKYEVPPPRLYKASGRPRPLRDIRRIEPDDRNCLFAMIRLEFPDLANAIELAIKENVINRLTREYISLEWVYIHLRRILTDLREDLDQLEIHRLIIDVIDDIELKAEEG